MEKTGDVQMVDNEWNKLFLFSCDFYGLYQVWVQEILTILIVRIFSFIERTNPLIV